MSVRKSPEECFAALKEQIVAVPDGKRWPVNIPEEEMMQEGWRVATLVEKYRDRLMQSDIDTVLLDTIADRAGAFAYCVAALESNVKVNDTNRVKYLDLKKEGFTLRRKLLAVYAYIFRSNTEIIAMLENIRTGRGDLEMFKDLLSIYKIYVDYKDRLNEAHFDASLAERAYTLYNELINLAAVLNIDPEVVSEVKVLINKSGALLWEALSEIHAAGRYVFYDHPDIEELFHVDYYLKVAQRRDSTTNKQPVEVTEEELPEPVAEPV